MQHMSFSYIGQLLLTNFYTKQFPVSTPLFLAGNESCTVTKSRVSWDFTAEPTELQALGKIMLTHGEQEKHRVHFSKTFLKKNPFSLDLPHFFRVDSPSSGNSFGALLWFPPLSSPSEAGYWGFQKSFKTSHSCLSLLYQSLIHDENYRFLRSVLWKCFQTLVQGSAFVPHNVCALNLRIASLIFRKSQK